MARVRVLGVDPGMTRCGIGVVDGAPGRVLSLVHVDVVRTPADGEIGVPAGRPGRRGGGGHRPLRA